MDLFPLLLCNGKHSKQVLSKKDVIDRLNYCAAIFNYFFVLQSLIS